MLGTRKDDGSVVALLPWGLSGYRFYDRTVGKYVRLNRKTEDMIESEALAFYKPFPLKRMGIPSLMRYIVEQIAPSDLAMLLLTMVVTTAVGLLIPRLNALLFSDVIASGSFLMLLGVRTSLICAFISAKSALLFSINSPCFNASAPTSLESSPTM